MRVSTNCNALYIGLVIFCVQKFKFLYYKWPVYGFLFFESVHQYMGRDKKTCFLPPCLKMMYKLNIKQNSNIFMVVFHLLSFVAWYVWKAQLCDLRDGLSKG